MAARRAGLSREPESPSVSSPPLYMFILPSFCLFDSSAIVPPLGVNLLEHSHCTRWSYPHKAFCLCLSSNHRNDTEGLTVQFTRNRWRLSWPHPCTGPFLLTFIFTCQDRDAAGARPPVHPSRLQRRRLSSSSQLVLWGEMLPLVYCMWPLLYACTSPLCTYQANYYSIATTFCCHPPVLWNIMEELLIYISYDASQLAVITPSACHWYNPPPPISCSKWFSPSRCLFPIIQWRFT